MAVAAALILPWSSAANVLALEKGPVISELSVLISGPPIKDANALLRYALPINNKQIKDVQKSLEEITEDMKLPGEKAFGGVERVCRWCPSTFTFSPQMVFFVVGVSNCPVLQVILALSSWWSLWSSWQSTHLGHLVNFSYNLGDFSLHLYMRLFHDCYCCHLCQWRAKFYMRC